MNIYLERLKALSDTTRFRIARVLEHSRDELCICELVDILRKPEYAVSRAARGLSAAGIVRERREGKLVYYRLADDPFVGKLAEVVGAVPPDDDVFLHDVDRLRWRTEIRSEGRCVVTYREREDRPKPRVLFVCVHNSARSQIAEGYLQKLAGDLFEVESAGLVPGELNPYAVAALAADGIDISAKRPQSVVDLYRSGRTYSYVITVCSREAEENCPHFPGPVARLSWPFSDPSRFSGSEGELAAQMIELRDQIRRRVTDFAAAIRSGQTSGGGER